MPCIPLVITSSLFFIPSILGIFKRKPLDVVATTALGCTSLWFHGSNSKLSYIIDKTYAHMFGVFYYTKSLLRFTRYHRACDFAVVCFGTGSILSYMKEGKVLNVILHSIVHLSSIAAFSLYIVTDNAGSHNVLPNVRRHSQRVIT